MVTPSQKIKKFESILSDIREIIPCMCNGHSWDTEFYRKTLMEIRDLIDNKYDLLKRKLKED